MNREEIIENLGLYKPIDEFEEKIRNDFYNFVLNNTDCFNKELKVGHITGSAIIIDKNNNRILIHKHKKLNKWVIFGGHADSEFDAIQIAKREGLEESGLKEITLLSENIFTIFIYDFPQTENFPAHKHYDLGFMFQADSKKEINAMKGESSFIKWIDIEDLEKFNNELSIKYLSSRLNNLLK